MLVSGYFSYTIYSSSIHPSAVLLISNNIAINKFWNYFIPSIFRIPHQMAQAFVTGTQEETGPFKLLVCLWVWIICLEDF